MNGPILVTSENRAGDVREVPAWPTGVPGLLVAAPTPCDGWWGVAHARSGTRFPFCMPDPEGALGLAVALRDVGDWQGPPEAVERLLTTVAYRAAVRPYLSWRCKHKRSALGVMRDNGVIA